MPGPYIELAQKGRTAQPRVGSFGRELGAPNQPA